MITMNKNRANVATMESHCNIAQLQLLQSYPLCMAQQYHLFRTDIKLWGRQS